MHIILDIDETLVSSLEIEDIAKGVVVIPPENSQLEFFDFEQERVFLRPFLQEFLHHVSRDNIVSIWSAGSREYVLDVANELSKFMYHPFQLVLWSAHTQASELATGNLKSINWLLQKLPCMRRFQPILLIDDLITNGQNQREQFLNVPAFVATKQGAVDDRVLIDLIEMNSTLSSNAKFTKPIEITIQTSPNIGGTIEA